MRALTAFLVVSAALSLSSCYNYDTDSFAKDKPTARDVSGTYTLVSQTVTNEGMKPFESSLPVIVLREDGTFEAKNVPPSEPWKDSNSEFHPASDFIKKLVSEKGKWTVEQAQGYSAIIFNSTNNSQEFFQANLTGRKPDYGMLIYIGDPDSGNSLYLKRPESPEPPPSPH